jgi:hypothetical protein
VTEKALEGTGRFHNRSRPRHRQNYEHETVFRPLG